MGSKLYVGNLSFNTQENELASFFEEGGYSVTSANVIVDRETGRSRGFGFVELGSEEQAQAAIEGLNGQSLDGRDLRIDMATDKPRRDGGGRGR